MASAMAAVTVAMATPASLAGKKAFLGSNASLFNPAKYDRLTSTPRSRSQRQLEVRASMKEKAIAGLTAAAVAAALVIPDVAEAAQPGVSPSLKNFLLSIVAGGVVLGAIGGAVIAVANFDPVKRT